MSEIKIVHYKKSIVLIGEGTKDKKEEIKSFGAKWNQHLQKSEATGGDWSAEDIKDNPKFKGWLFPQSKEAEVRQKFNILD